MDDRTDWPSLLAPTTAWQDCYPQVEAHVWGVLYRSQGRTFSTRELMAEVWPEAGVASGAATKAERNRLSQALMALAKHSMAACVTRGEKVLRYKTAKNPNGILIQPYLWRAPA